jgi:hypothetical protein
MKTEVIPKIYTETFETAQKRINEIAKLAAQGLKPK